MAGLAASLCPAFADTVLFSGNFTTDDNLEGFAFTLTGASTVTIRTLSFANGGFEPILTLFDAAGGLLTQDTTGGTAPGACGPRAIDPVSNFCLDAYIQTPLSAGNYLAFLTEADNVANGPTLADGFLHQGEGNFTGPEFTGNPGSFVLFDTSQRASDWSVEISGLETTSISAIPEPGGLPFLLCACAILAFFVKLRIHRNKPTPSKESL